MEKIDRLRQNLPELFDDRSLPEGWTENWVAVEVSPESQSFFVGEDYPVTPRLPDFGSIDTFTQNDPAETSPAPGGPITSWDSDYLPPPDALAFYLPFHYYHPHWWGIYLTPEGIAWLADVLFHYAGGRISNADAHRAAQAFLYGHESFHMKVESFATRLEQTHRTPLYRRGFEDLYQSVVGTDDCIEESLASAYGIRRVRQLFSNTPAVQRAVDAALVEYTRDNPPGYRRAEEFLSDLRYQRALSDFAEENHLISLPAIPGIDPQCWLATPHWFSGITNAGSRTVFLVGRHSPLYQRLSGAGKLLCARDVIRRVEKVAGCARAGQKGSHGKWRCPNGGAVTIPIHGNRDIPVGTLGSIIKQAGLNMTPKEFMALKV